MADDFSKRFPTWVAGRPWPKTFEGKNKTHIRRDAVLRSYVPDSRQQLVNAVNDYIYGGGREGHKYAERVASVLDLPLGLGHGIYDTIRATAEGRPGDAALAAGLTVLPGPDGPVRAAVNKVKRGLEEVVEAPAKSLLISKPKPEHDLPGQPEGTIFNAAEEDSIFDPPKKPQRPFKADYPDGAESDAAGNLLKDKDGDPLTAKYVAGRRTVGGDDIGLTPAEFKAIGEEIVDKAIEIVPPGDLEDALGMFRYRADTKEPYDIRIADNLTQGQHDKVLGHEVGHAAHLKTGHSPIEGPDVEDELNRNFSTLATGEENRLELTLPESFGYTGSQTRNEKMAEAFRAAFTDPNYFKTVAPNSADALRKLIKKYPELAKIVQMNSLAAAGVGLALTGQGENSEAKETPPKKHQPQPNVLSGAYSIFGPPVPFDPVSAATKLGPGGAKISETLVRRGLSPQATKAGKFNNIVHALLDREARRKQKPPSYGGPR